MRKLIFIQNFQRTQPDGDNGKRLQPKKDKRCGINERLKLAKWNVGSIIKKKVYFLKKLRITVHILSSIGTMLLAVPCLSLTFLLILSTLRDTALKTADTFTA